MNALFDRFDAVYIVNLAVRTDRRREMTQQLRNVGVAPDHPKLHWLAASKPAHTGGFPTVGAHGCFLSHLSIIRMAVERGQHRVLILEDDLDFAPDFSVRQHDAIAATEDAPWSFFYACHALADDVADHPARHPANHPADHPSDATAHATAHATAQATAHTTAIATDKREAHDSRDAWVSLAPGQRVEQTHWVALQGQAIAQLQRHFEAILDRPPGHPDGGPMHVDGAYSHFRAEHPEHRTLQLRRALGHQRASRTDIHALPWFDRYWGIRGLASYARRRKNA